MSYYDIDAILTDAQKVPCTFEITIPGLGYLEGNPNDDVSVPQLAYFVYACTHTQDRRFTCY